MTRKRTVIVFAALLAGLIMLEVRLLLIISDAGFAEAAASQSVRTVELAGIRADFTDMNGAPLTGGGEKTLALVMPQTAAGYALLVYIDDDERDGFLERMLGELPFAVQIDASLEGRVPQQTARVNDRYGGEALCRHLIGTLDGEGRGASGLELALDAYLTESAGAVCATYSVNANGGPIDGETPAITERGVSGTGVTLTIDSRVQRAVERCASKMMSSGAVVALDAQTAELRAMASAPDFEQDNVAAYLNDPREPLFNRALGAYNVGSIYKPVLAACALNSRLGGGRAHECGGVIEVNSQSYACNDSTAHGALDMRTAIVKSCNTYFISLGCELGGEAIYNAAASLSLNRALALCDGLASARGSFPSAKKLSVSSELCNHCFGQGTLLLSPLHVAAYTRCIASGGLYRAPSVIKSVGGRAAPPNEDSRVFSETAADEVAGYMIEAVENGTGFNAKPQKTTAAGKTGTAQTGRYDAGGSERTIGWFTGWFPAEEPKYVVTVMTEDGGYGYESAAPVFAAIADELCALGLA